MRLCWMRLDEAVLDEAVLEEAVLVTWPFCPLLAQTLEEEQKSRSENSSELCVSCPTTPCYHGPHNTPPAPPLPWPQWFTLLAYLWGPPFSTISGAFPADGGEISKYSAVCRSWQALQSQHCAPRTCR